MSEPIAARLAWSIAPPKKNPDAKSDNLFRSIEVLRFARENTGNIGAGFMSTQDEYDSTHGRDFSTRLMDQTTPVRENGRGTGPAAVGMMAIAPTSTT